MAAKDLSSNCSALMSTTGEKEGACVYFNVDAGVQVDRYILSLIAAAKVCAIAIMATSELHANIIIRLSMRNLREPEAVC